MTGSSAPRDGLRGFAERPVRWFSEAPRALQDRLIGAGMAVPSGAVLGTALWLEPDASGVGTHTQLGLGGCTVLTTFDVPCPMCGMTTTFTHLAHLEVLDGVLNQPFGLVLFSLTVLAFAAGTADILRPAGRWRRMLGVVDRHEGALAGAIFFGMLGGWAWKWADMAGQLPFLP